MEFDGKKAVVTGASSGIGAGIARGLAGLGADVLAVSRSISPEDLPYEGIRTVRYDVSSKEGTDALFEYALGLLGGIDVFIANAGYGYYGLTSSPDWVRINDMFSLNVFSPVYSLEKMCGLNEKSPFYFAVTCSVAGKLPLPGFSLYCATKFALDGFMRAFRFELPYNGKLSVIYPVSTGTSFFKKSGKDVPVPGPVQPAEDAVKKIMKGLVKGKKEIYPSPVYAVLNVASHICPPAVNTFLDSENTKFHRWLYTHGPKNSGNI